MKQILAMAMLVMLYSCANETKTTDDTTVAVTTTENTVGVEVPPAVDAAYKEAYPDIIGTWETKDSMYIASFNNNGLDMAVIYKADGTRHAVVAAMDAAYLPEPVQKAAAAMGPITEAHKLTLDNETVRYEVHVGNDDYYFDESGAMIQEEAAIKDIQNALQG